MNRKTIVDLNGNYVAVGDTIRVIKLPNVDLSVEEMQEVETMLGGEFKIESIENGCAEVTKWWKSEDDTWCHSLFLFSNEFELVKRNNAS